MQNSKKLFTFSLASALIFCVFFSMISFSASCEEMYDNIIRIRIIANSNEEKDQKLKIAVRDEILKSSQNLFQEDTDFDEVLLIAKENINAFKEVAEKTVKENGFDYLVSAKVKEEYFDTRVYDDFTLPSGEYQTLVITLGEGKGENWWCVMYPSVCIGACSDKLEESISQTAAEKAYNPQNYVAKFKVVEIYESLKKIFAKT